MSPFKRKHWQVQRTLALVGGLATTCPGAWAQVIQLSAIEAGAGPGFDMVGEAAIDWAGESMSAAGDVNGDGLGDIIVGAAQNDSVFGNNTGRSYVVFGTTSNTTLELSTLVAGTSSLGFVINGAMIFEFAGRSVSGAGDVNGDGLADVIVGALGSDTFSYADNHGRAYVVFGKTDTASVQLSAIMAGTSAQGFAIVGAANGDALGGCVSGAGDVNGDGLADVIVGADWADPFGLSKAGIAYVVFGKTDHDPVYLQNSTFPGFAIRGEAVDDQAGDSVSGAGDVNGDGRMDLIVGAPFHEAPPASGSGRSYVVFGKSSTAAVDLSAVATGTSPLGFPIMGEPVFGAAGYATGAGDMNGDGLSDVIVAAPVKDVPAGALAGRTYVVFGKSDSAAIQLSQVATGTTLLGFAIDGQAADDISGTGISSGGDINGDGLADVVIGAPQADVGAKLSTGRTYVVFGRYETTTVQLSEVATGSSTLGFVIEGSVLGDLSGRHVATAGDIDGDGLPNLLTAATHSNDGPVADVGRTYLLTPPVEATFSGTYFAYVAPGDIPRTGIGTNRLGNDLTAFPDSRLWIDLDGGTGFGVGDTSLVNATLSRAEPGIMGYTSAQLADVSWYVYADRVGWSTARVTLRYTDEEIAGLDEANLVILESLFFGLPFTPATGIVRDPARNEISCDVTLLPRVLALTDSVGGGVANGDANADGDVNVADYTAIRNEIELIEFLPLNGDGDVDNDSDVDLDDADALREFLVNGTPLP